MGERDTNLVATLLTVSGYIATVYIGSLLLHQFIKQDEAFSSFFLQNLVIFTAAAIVGKYVVKKSQK